MATKTRKPKRRERVAKLARKYYGAVEIAERVGCAPATVYSDLRSLVHQTTKNLILSDNRRQAQAKGVPDGLQLESPSATAAIRGTSWEFDVDAAGTTTLTVLTGSVEFFNAQAA